MKKDILNSLRQDEAIDEEVLEALLREQGDSKSNIESIVNKVYKEDSKSSISEKEMHILSDLIRHSNTQSLLNNKDWVNLLTDALSYITFTVVFSVFLWMIWISQSRATIDFGIEPTIVILISFSIIFLIAILEGSQIAIINISDKDLSSVSDKYPIAYEIQKLTRTKKSIQDYLIGRQLLVVALVTIFSLLTSFPNIQSITDVVPLPKIVDIIAFKLGLLNALILLWIGQLIPQLLASKAPKKILNHPLVKYIIHLCFLIAHSKIAKPSSLAVDLANLKEHEPPMSNYEQFIKEIDTYRHYVDNLNINITYVNNSNITAESKIHFIFAGNVNHIIRRSLMFYGELKNQKTTNIKYLRKNNEEFPLINTSSNHDLIENNGISFFSQKFEPQTGSFNDGDILKITDYLELTDLQQIDIRIDRPTRVLFIKCSIPEEILKNKNLKIPDLSIDILILDAPTEEYIHNRNIKISPVNKNGYLTAYYSCLFPQLNSSFSINWDIE